MVHDWSVSVPDRKALLSNIERLLPLNIYHAVMEACSVAPTLAGVLKHQPIPCLDAETGDTLFHAEVPDICRYRGLRLLKALWGHLPVQ